MENFTFSPLTYITIFFSGVLTSFTPCVYPLIPIVVGIIGASKSESRFSGLSLSVSYVFGLAITYTILGAAASLTGSFFGKIQTSPVTNIAVGSIIILMGLWMLDAVSIPVPVISTPRFSGKGIFTAIAAGFVSGFVAAPCTTPVLGSILVLVAARQNIFFGTTLLFVFALGMGTVLIIVGTFTGIAIPKSGKWMVIVKKVFGFLMIVLGAYFIFLAGKYS